MNQLVAIRAFEALLAEAVTGLVGRRNDRIICASRSGGHPGRLGVDEVPKDVDDLLDVCMRSRWQFGSVGYPIQNSGLDRASWQFSMNLVSAQLVCNQGGDGTPQTHDSGWRGLDGPLTAHTFEKRASDAVVQVFSVAFQCQDCLGEPIVFSSGEKTTS